MHRLTDRDEFEHAPARLDSRRLIIPWMVSYLRDGDRVIDIAGGVGTYASVLVRERPAFRLPRPLTGGLRRRPWGTYRG